jgi:hypothetical protein
MRKLKGKYYPPSPPSSSSSSGEEEEEEPMQPAAGGGKSEDITDKPNKMVHTVEVAPKSVSQDDEVLASDIQGEEIVEVPKIVASEVGDKDVIANAMAATANATSLELASDIQGEEIVEIPRIVASEVGDKDFIANAVAATANLSSLELASDIQGEELVEIQKIVASEVGGKEVIANAVAATANLSSLEQEEDSEVQKIEEISLPASKNSQVIFDEEAADELINSKAIALKMATCATKNETKVFSIHDEGGLSKQSH